MSERRFVEYCVVDEQSVQSYSLNGWCFIQTEYEMQLKLQALETKHADLEKKWKAADALNRLNNEAQEQSKRCAAEATQLASKLVKCKDEIGERRWREMFP